MVGSSFLISLAPSRVKEKLATKGCGTCTGSVTIEGHHLLHSVRVIWEKVQLHVDTVAHLRDRNPVCQVFVDQRLRNFAIPVISRSPAPCAPSRMRTVCHLSSSPGASPAVHRASCCR